MAETDDETVLRSLYAHYYAAARSAIEAAQAAPKPLEGSALRDFLEAEVTEIIRRIKAIRTTRKPL
jgi:uncharacterized protein YicC (UPF0701 family)